jgi:NAD-dependent dihydropyrimidine dehydrogenase PreA subunit
MEGYIAERGGGERMGDTEKRDRGSLRVDTEECKGCGLCVEACPPKAIRLSERLNRYGYRTAIYLGAGCTGCGICFMACPEPGAITVLRRANPKAAEGCGPGIAMEGACPCASN